MKKTIISIMASLLFLISSSLIIQANELVSFSIISDKNSFVSWDKFIASLNINTWWEDSIGFSALIKFDNQHLHASKLDDSSTAVGFWADQEIDNEHWEIILSWWFPWGYNVSSDTKIVDILFKIKSEQWKSIITIDKERSSIRDNSDEIQNILWSVRQLEISVRKDEVVEDFTISSKSEETLKASAPSNISKIDEEKLAAKMVEEAMANIKKIKETYNKNLAQRQKDSSAILALSSSVNQQAAKTMSWELITNTWSIYDELSDYIAQITQDWKKYKINVYTIIWIEWLVLWLLFLFFYMYKIRKWWGQGQDTWIDNESKDWELGKETKNWDNDSDIINTWFNGIWTVGSDNNDQKEDAPEELKESELPDGSKENESSEKPKEDELSEKSIQEEESDKTYENEEVSKPDKEDKQVDNSEESKESEISEDTSKEEEKSGKTEEDQQQIKEPKEDELVNESEDTLSTMPDHQVWHGITDIQSESIDTQKQSDIEKSIREKFSGNFDVAKDLIQNKNSESVEDSQDTENLEGDEVSKWDINISDNKE